VSPADGFKITSVYVFRPRVVYSKSTNFDPRSVFRYRLCVFCVTACLAPDLLLCPAVTSYITVVYLLRPRLFRVRALVVTRGQFSDNGCVFVASQVL
jgi:hypothetical protein